MTQAIRFVEDESRPEPLGRALAAIPLTVYEAIDRGEPEWPVLERLVPLGSAGLLTGLALALSDFQLGGGGATQYWHEAADLLGVMDLNARDDVRGFMRLLMKRAVASRLRELKLARVDKLLASEVPNILEARTIEELGQQPLTLWYGVAAGMRQLPQDKTVAFAMKIFDLMHRIATGRYATFGVDVPIVADLRIARVSLSSGLLRPAESTTVQTAMEAVAAADSCDQEHIRAMWMRVAEVAHGISLFRIDSLIWQISEPIFRLRHDRNAAVTEVRSTISKYGAEAPKAAEVAAQMTAAL